MVNVLILWGLRSIDFILKKCIILGTQNKKNQNQKDGNALNKNYNKKINHVKVFLSRYYTLVNKSNGKCD